MAIITSESVADAVDRLEFASAIAEGDTDLATRVSVATQELEWQQDRLADAVARQSEALAALDDQQASIQAELERYSARVEELEDQLAAEQAPPVPTRNGGTDVGGAPPGGDPGSPAPGRRRGMAPDVPRQRRDVVRRFLRRPASRRTEPRGHRHDRRSRDAGGRRCTRAPCIARAARSAVYGVVLFHDGGSDWTFYTHFDSYGSYGEGSHVSAGSTIGYVGNTGTTVYHLHFEYHPGGGAAMNPYSALLGVC